MDAEILDAVATTGTRGPRGRLLFILNEAYFFVSHRLPVARAAQAAGYEVHVAAPPDHVWAPESFHIDELERLGFVFHPVPLSRRGMNPFRDLSTFLYIVALLRRVRPDLLHLVTIKPNLYGGIAARLTGVPRVVYAVTGLGQVFIGKGVAARLVRRAVSALLRFSFRHPNSRLIFQNPDDRAQLVGAGVAPSRNSRVILGSGVDVAGFRFTPDPGGEPTVVLCSRLIWEKGIAEFVAAARQLRAAGVRARWALVGGTRSSNPRAVPQATLEGWAADGVVEWWGFRTDIDAILAGAHVVCLPSTYGEGVPKILLEAAAVGRPIVTTDIPGCREAVRPGVTGFLVRPGDAADLAEKLRTLLLDPALRSRMGLEARGLAEAAFDQKRIVQETLRVYDELG